MMRWSELSMTDAGRRTIGEHVLAVLRIVLGLMLLWAFLDKLLGLGFPTTPEAAMVNGGSPTQYYLTYLVDGVFADLYRGLAGNAVLDMLLMAGLLLVGIALVLGIASKLATWGMCVMMALMWSLEVPPDDNALLLDYHIAYLLAAVAVYYLGGFRAWGLHDRWCELGPVRRLSVLE